MYQGRASPRLRPNARESPSSLLHEKSGASPPGAPLICWAGHTSLCPQERGAIGRGITGHDCSVRFPQSGCCRRSARIEAGACGAGAHGLSLVGLKGVVSKRCSATLS
jgi:hypothetical protein